MEDRLGDEPASTVDPYVDRLLAALDEAQQYLVNEINLLYGQSTKWPVFGYVEHLLARLELDALDVLASFPWISSARPNGWEYWPVFYSRRVRPAPESHVELTVLGLAQANSQLDCVGSFLRVLAALAEARATSYMDPFSAKMPLLPVNDLWTRLRIPPVVPDSVLGLLPREPATAETRLVEDPERGLCLELSPTLLRYRGVQDVRDYITCVVDQVGPAPAEGAPIADSPYTLPAAIDYLSIVWLEKYGQRLARVPNFEVAAKLSYAAASGDEFNSRLSGLAETLKLFDPGKTPGVDGHPLQRLASFLEARLSPSAMRRVRDAVSRLDAVRRIRVSGQHTADNLALTTDLRRFGVASPILNWAEAWSAISTGVVTALDAIREEVQAADRQEDSASNS